MAENDTSHVENVKPLSLKFLALHADGRLDCPALVSIHRIFPVFIFLSELIT